MFLIIIEYLSFSCSPIHKKRLILKFKLDDNSREQSKSSKSDIVLEDSIDEAEKSFEVIGNDLKNIGPNDDDFSHMFWAILHPIQASRLIKRYHMAGNVFIIMFLIHIILVTHLTIKSIIYTFFASSDKAFYQYLNNIYYPHIAGVFREPELFNNLILIFSSLSMCIRLRSAYKLIKSSIINRETYKELRMSQVNFSNLTLYELTLFDWIEFFLFSFQHDEDIENHPEIAQAHFSLSNLFNEIELDSLTQKETLYHYNLFDWSECYLESIVEFDLKERRDKYRDWFSPLPASRISAGQLRRVIIFALLCESVSMFGLACCLFGCAYLELRSTLPSDYETAKTIELFFRWGGQLIEPIHLIRMFELFIFILLQVPLHYDSGLVLLDATVLISRTSKLREIFQYVLNHCEERDISTDVLKKQRSNLHEINYLAFNNILMDTNYKSEKSNQSLEDDYCSSRIEELNIKLQHSVKLTKLLYLEFADMKRMHSMYLNLLIIVMGLTVSYTISLLFRIKSSVDLIILVVMLIAISVPVMNTLIVCAMIERKVSQFSLKIIQLLKIILQLINCFNLV